MAVECSSKLMRRCALIAGAAAALALSGCVVAPLDGYDVGAPVVYPGSTTYYYEDAPYPFYSGPSYYYGGPYYRRPYWGGSSLWLEGSGYYRDRPPRQWQRPSPPPPLRAPPPPAPPRVNLPNVPPPSLSLPRGGAIRTP